MMAQASAHIERAGQTADRTFKAVSNFFKRTATAAAAALNGGERPSDRCVARLLALNSELNERVDRRSHAKLLRRLWAGAVVSEEEAQGDERRVPKFALPSPEWRRMGFQHDDPSTDFRGGGVLALRCLVFCCEKYGWQFRRLREDVGGELPLCVASINLCLMLVRMLGIEGSPGSITANQLPPQNWWRLMEDETAFFETFCISLAVLCQLWRQSGASQADFREQVDAVRRRVAEFVNNDFADAPALVDAAARGGLWF
jgi:hypothetical protein